VVLSLYDMKHLLEEHGILLVDTTLVKCMPLAAPMVQVREPLRLLVVDGGLQIH